MAAQARPRRVGRLWLIRLPRPVPADVVLTAVLAAFSVVVTLFFPSLWSGSRWAAVIVGVAQTLPMLWRRSHPVIGLVVYCATKPVQYLVAPVSEWPWLVLVYSLFVYRRPRLAAVVLALTVVATYPSSAAVFSAAHNEGFLSELLVFAVGVTPQLVGAAVLGWAIRVTRARAIRQRERADRARVAAEVGRERERIAIELDSVVVERLRRLASWTERLREQSEGSSRSGQQVLSEVYHDALRALAALRRALGFLRSERSALDSAAQEPLVRRWVPPKPTLSGLGLAGVSAAAAVLVDQILRYHGMLPDRPPDQQSAEFWSSLFLHQDRPWSLVLLFIEFAALGWWRSAPLAALAVYTIASSGTYLMHSDHIVESFGGLLLVYAAGAGAPPLASALTVAGMMLTFEVAFLLDTRPLSASTQLFIFLWTVTPWAAGALRRRAAQRARQRVKDRMADEVRVALAQERNRIARELHDVLGHYVSAIVVQAGAARSVAGTEPDVVRDAIGHIEEAGRRIREALPALLALAPAAIAAPLRLDAQGVEQLVAPLRSAGLPVTIEVQGEVRESPDEVELFAQRILMEALTNVLRHAGPTPTHVRLEHQPDVVTVEVADAGPVARHRPARDGGGHGLIGMRERSELLGGALSAGRHGERGWRVQARLPHPPSDPGGLLLPEEETQLPGKSSPARTRGPNPPP